MNRKIALSGLSIVAALTLMGGATFAQFTTTATASDNTFSTTTPTLTISTDGGIHFGTSEPGFTVGGLVPGGSTANQNFQLQNINTDPSGDLSISLKFTNLGGGLNPNDISFTVQCGSDSAQTDTYAGWVANIHTFPTALAHNSTEACTMSASLSSSAGNSDIGQNVNFDAVFTGSVGT